MSAFSRGLLFCVLCSTLLLVASLRVVCSASSPLRLSLLSVRASSLSLGLSALALCCRSWRLIALPRLTWSFGPPSFTLSVRSSSRCWPRLLCSSFPFTVSILLASDAQSREARDATRFFLLCTSYCLPACCLRPLYLPLCPSLSGSLSVSLSAFPCYTPLVLLAARWFARSLSSLVCCLFVSASSFSSAVRASVLASIYPIVSHSPLSSAFCAADVSLRPCCLLKFALVLSRSASLLYVAVISGPPGFVVVLWCLWV